LPVESVYPPIGTPISWVMSPPRRRSGGVDHRARAPSARGPPRHRDRRLARLGASGV